MFTERGTFVVQDRTPGFNDYQVVKAAVEQELRDDLVAANEWWDGLTAEQRVYRFREAVRLQAWEGPGDRGLGVVKRPPD